MHVIALFEFITFLFTYATAANSAVACSIVCAVAIAASSSVVAVVGIAAVARTAAAAESWMTARAVAASWMTTRAAGCYCGRPTAPFADSKPDAAPKSSYASPSCACGCLNTACCGTP